MIHQKEPVHEQQRVLKRSKELTSEKNINTNQQTNPHYHGQRNDQQGKTYNTKQQPHNAQTRWKKRMWWQSATLTQKMCNVLTANTSQRTVVSEVSTVHEEETTNDIVAFLDTV